MFAGEPDPRFAEKYFLVASVVSGNQSIEEIVSNRPDISERELKQWMHVTKEAARRSFTEPDLRARTVIKETVK